MSVEQVEVQRDCEVVAIPEGTTTTLGKGTVAFITQSLGGSYTLQVPPARRTVPLSWQGWGCDRGQELTTVGAESAGGDLEEQILGSTEILLRPRDPGQHR